MLWQQISSRPNKFYFCVRNQRRGALAAPTGGDGRSLLCSIYLGRGPCTVLQLERVKREARRGEDGEPRAFRRVCGVNEDVADIVVVVAVPSTRPGGSSRGSASRRLSSKSPLDSELGCPALVSNSLACTRDSSGSRPPSLTGFSAAPFLRNFGPRSRATPRVVPPLPWDLYRSLSLSPAANSPAVRSRGTESSPDVLALELHRIVTIFGTHPLDPPHEVPFLT